MTLRLSLAIVLACGSTLSAQVQTPGVIDAVTVYRGQALVTRSIEVPAAGDGTGQAQELIITDLPEAMVPGSLFAEGDDGIQVRGVRFRVRPVERDVRDEVRAIDERITDAQARLHAVERQGQVLADYNAYLGRLEEFVGAAATVEMSRGVLDAATVKNISEFLLAQRRSLASEALDLEGQARIIGGELEIAQRQRDQVARDGVTDAREAVLIVSKPRVLARVRLTYLVTNAGWSPSYTVRAEGSAGLVVEYHAAVEQMSGEDWTGVSMTLSTATPALACAAPSIESMPISLASAPQATPAPAEAVKYKDELRRKQRELDAYRNQSERVQQGMEQGLQSAGPGGPLFDKGINDLASEAQIIDLVSTGNLTKRGDALGQNRGFDEGLSVTYALPDRLSLPSRRDVQQVLIAATPMNAERYKVASPVLTEYVYDEAIVTNTGGRVLLAGPVSAYVDGRFVGRGDMPTIAAGQTFTVGLGIDSSMRASRELIEKTDQIQGGNRVVDLRYRIAIENYGDRPASVRVRDRIPAPTTPEVKVTLTDPGPGLVAEEPASQARAKGKLRWDAEVRPGTTAFEYEFRIEHDKQMSISTGG